MPSPGGRQGGFCGLRQHFCLLVNLTGQRGARGEPSGQDCCHLPEHACHSVDGGRGAEGQPLGRRWGWPPLPSKEAQDLARNVQLQSSAGARLDMKRAGGGSPAGSHLQRGPGEPPNHLLPQTQGGYQRLRLSPRGCSAPGTPKVLAQQKLSPYSAAWKPLFPGPAAPPAWPWVSGLVHPALVVTYQLSRIRPLRPAQPEHLTLSHHSQSRPGKTDARVQMWARRCTLPQHPSCEGSATPRSQHHGASMSEALVLLSYIPRGTFLKSL